MPQGLALGSFTGLTQGTGFYEEEYFDVSFNVSPEPQINSISQGILHIKPLKFDSYLQINFHGSPDLIILPETYNTSTKLNEELIIPVNITFKESGPSGMDIIISITDENYSVQNIETGLRKYFFVPFENKEDLENWRKDISFKEQKDIPRISDFPTKAHEPIPFRDEGKNLLWILSIILFVFLVLILALILSRKKKF